MAEQCPADCGDALRTANISSRRSFLKWSLTNHPDKVAERAIKARDSATEIERKRKNADDKFQKVSGCVTECCDDDKCVQPPEFSPTRARRSPGGFRRTSPPKWRPPRKYDPFQREPSPPPPSPEPEIPPQEPVSRGEDIHLTPEIQMPDTLAIADKIYKRVSSVPLQPHYWIYRNIRSGNHYLLQVYERQFLGGRNIKSSMDQIKNQKWPYILEYLGLYSFEVIGPLGDSVVGFVFRYDTKMIPLSNVLVETTPDKDPELWLAFAWSALGALRILHNKMLVLRRITAASFLVKKLPNGGYRIMLADFSYLYNLQLPESLNMCYNYPGEDPTVPPEVIMKNAPLGANDCKAVDMWAFGMILYSIVTRSEPGLKGGPVSRAKELKKFANTLNISLPQLGIGEAPSQIILECLKAKPTARPTAEMLRQYLLDNQQVCIIKGKIYLSSEVRVLRDIFETVLAGDCRQLQNWIDSNQAQAQLLVAQYIAKYINTKRKEIIGLADIVSRLNIFTSETFVRDLEGVAQRSTFNRESLRFFLEQLEKSSSRYN